jgi:hypothetical protein
MFLKSYEELLMGEELDRALAMVEDKINKAEMHSDKFLLEFYQGYKTKVLYEIKYQRMRYQKLFEKEKNFRKAFNNTMKPKTLESYHKAKQMTELAIKYAQEQQLNSVLIYLNRYLGYVDAMIFNEETTYDLKKLTNNRSYFEKNFYTMLSADTLEVIENAGTLVDNCYYFTIATNGKLDSAYFVLQRAIVANALSDYLEKHGKYANLADYTDQAVIAKYDSINPDGVYKWGNYIIVIDCFNPSSTSLNVQIGEAILDADKKLAKYLRYKDIARITEGDKMGRTFLLPYVKSGEKTYFMYDLSRSVVQYMACYTMVSSPVFTQEISKYLPPLVFQ